MNYNVHIAFLLLPFGVHAGTIKLRVLVTGDDDVSAEGIGVECWDYDPLNSDDFMKRGTTDSNGFVTLSYDSKSTWYGWDGVGSNKPDIYCEVSTPGDCVVPVTTVTKNNQNAKGTTDFGTIQLVADEAYCDINNDWNGCGPEDYPVWLSEIADEVSGFKTSCSFHDHCYGRCDEKRSHCDRMFKQDMYYECDGGASCKLLADLFYSSVDLAGKSSCEEAREQTGCSQDGKALCNQ